MKANEFKFKVTNKDGISAVISLADLRGNEDDWYGDSLFIGYWRESIPDQLLNEKIIYEFNKINDELEFEYVSNEGEI